jgi:branched-chain amino acid transport system permease protein
VARGARIGALVAVLAALHWLAPLVLNPYYVTILARIGIAVIAAVSLQLVNGFTGQFSIGHAGFMALGAYSSAAFSVYLGAAVLDGLGGGGLARLLYFPFPLVCGGLVAAAGGLVVAVPALRLRGDYLAIATLGAGEIIRIGILNVDAVGGARGFSLASAAHPAVDLRFESLAGVYGVAVVTIVAIARLVYSGGGLAFRAVREDEIAAESLGVPTTRVKVEAFLVASFFAGVAGALFAHSEGYIHTNSFTFVRSFELVTFVVLGGLGSLSGAVVAAATLTAAPELLRGLGEWRMILYSALLIVTMILRPQGLLGQRELLPFGRRRRGAP